MTKTRPSISRSDQNEKSSLLYTPYYHILEPTGYIKPTGYTGIQLNGKV